MSPPLRRRGVPIVVDDTDPALQYQGEWSRQTPSPGQLNNTVTGTVEQGASVSYTFKGTPSRSRPPRPPILKSHDPF